MVSLPEVCSTDVCVRSRSRANWLKVEVLLEAEEGKRCRGQSRRPDEADLTFVLTSRGHLPDIFVPGVSSDSHGLHLL